MSAVLLALGIAFGCYLVERALAARRDNWWRYRNRK